MSYTLKVKKTVKDSFVTLEPTNIEYAEMPVYSFDSASITLSSPDAVAVGITAEGYEDYGQTIYVNKDITIEPKLNRYVSLTIVPEPSDAKVIIEYGGKTYNQKTLDNIIANTKVSYVVSKINKETVSDSIILNSSQSLRVSLIDKITSDAGIGNFEGTEGTDISSQIKLISENDFNKLDGEIQKDYVRYDPTLSNFIGIDYTTLMSDAITQLNILSPIASKITPMTNGTLDQANYIFGSLINQIGPIANSASGITNSIRRIGRAASKVGLGSLVDILLKILQLIGSLSAIMTSTIFNPNNVISQYVEVFKDVNIKEVLEKTINQTIPELQYSLEAIQSKIIPDEALKQMIIEKTEEMLEVAETTEKCAKLMMNLQCLFEMYKQLERDVRTILILITIVTSGGSMAAVIELLKMLMIDYDVIKNNFGKNDYFNNMRCGKRDLNDTLCMERKYIDSQDLEYLNELNGNNNISEEEYSCAYKDALENASNGETREQMEARINKYIMEMEQLGKDYTSYVKGYQLGWEFGSEVYKNFANGLMTDEQNASYNNGYQAGYKFGSNIVGLAKHYITLGKLKYIVDIDNHIHDYEYNPVGRIGNDNKIYSFPDENIIGEYYVKTSEIKLNNKTYSLEDGLIFDPTDIIENPTKEDIEQMIEDVHKYMLIMIERGNPPEGNINPYYAKGWEEGYKNRKEENITINNSIIQNQNGNNDGYNYASNGTTVSQLTDIIENSTENIFYNQGLINGYNKYQAEYNVGYGNAWLGSINAKDYEEYDSNKSLEWNLNKNNNLNLYNKMCENKQNYFYDNYNIAKININWNGDKFIGTYAGTEKTLADFNGALIGYDDSYKAIDQTESSYMNYHNIYIKNY